MNNCKWTITTYCSTNPAFRKCVPEWLCACVGDIDCYNCDRFCWAACPSWSEWTSMHSPSFLTFFPEFRERGCPCDRKTLLTLGSPIFQSDRANGHCVQTRLLTGLSAFPWNIFYLGLGLLFFFIRCTARGCVRKAGWRTPVHETNVNIERDGREIGVWWVHKIVDISYGLK